MSVRPYYGWNAISCDSWCNKFRPRSWKASVKQWQVVSGARDGKDAPQWAPGPLLGSHTGLRGQTGTICLSSCMLLPQKYLTNHSSSKSKKKKLNRFWNIECHPSSFSLTWVFLHFLSLLSSSNSRLAQKIFSPSSSSSSLSRMSFHSELVFPILPTSPQARVWHPAQQGVSYKSEEGMKKKDCPPTQTSKSERSNN